MPVKNSKVKDVLDFSGSLAAAKEINYRNSLAVSALIELLSDKGIISKKDFTNKTREIERADLAGIFVKYRQTAGK